MSRVIRYVRAGLFTAVLTGSLGFGAAQAIARPSSGESTARACTKSYCDSYCKSRLGSQAVGFCQPNGSCLCAV